MLTDRPLPSDTELERAVIAGVLGCNDQRAARRIAAMVRAEVFAVTEHNRAWQVIRDLAASGTIDRINWMTRAGSICGVATVASVLSGEGMSASALDVAVSCLSDMAHRRALMLGAAAAWQSASDGTPAGDVSRQIDEVRRQAIAAFGGDSAITLAEAGVRYDGFRERLNSGEVTSRLYTGIADIDRHGPVPPEYCLIMARSSIGKTAFALSMALQQVRAGHRVLIWSGEQQVEMIACKLICLLTGLGSQQVLGIESVTISEQDNINVARQLLDKLPIALLDGRKSVEQVWGYAASLKGAKGLDAIYLDQFDKLTAPGTMRQNREERMGEVSRSLFGMCLDLKTPVFCLVQLGLKAQKDHATPEPWQVRDCSQIVQDCDRAYVLDRPSAEPDRWQQMTTTASKLAAKGSRSMQEELTKLETSAIVRLAKNRNGIGGCWRELVPFEATCGRYGRRG
jgi:replicative DNA helicase